MVLGITPIASYYRISIAQVAGSIGTTTHDVLNFLAAKTESQLIGDIQGFYFVCRTVARKLKRTIRRDPQPSTSHQTGAVASNNRARSTISCALDECSLREGKR
jgi:hypothetical protein